MAMKLFSPKMLMNALAADIALVLDELEAELILTQHIQGVCFSVKPMLQAGCSEELKLPRHSSKPRFKT